MSANPQYEVVSPLGQTPRKGGDAQPAAGLTGLQGKKVGLFWNGFTNGNLLLDALADLLSKRYPGMEFVKLKSGRDLDWGNYPDRTLTALAREAGIHAAIAGPGC
jgi:hypothetical protein